MESYNIWLSLFSGFFHLTFSRVLHVVPLVVTFQAGLIFFFLMLTFNTKRRRRTWGPIQQTKATHTHTYTKATHTQKQQHKKQHTFMETYSVPGTEPGAGLQLWAIRTSPSSLTSWAVVRINLIHSCQVLRANMGVLPIIAVMVRSSNGRVCCEK